MSKVDVSKWLEGERVALRTTEDYQRRMLSLFADNDPEFLNVVLPFVDPAAWESWDALVRGLGEVQCFGCCKVMNPPDFAFMADFGLGSVSLETLGQVSVLSLCDSCRPGTNIKVLTMFAFLSYQAIMNEGGGDG